MPIARTQGRGTGVDAFLVVAALAIVAAWAAVIIARRRAVRRAAAERARLRARRRKVPVVSANLRGLEYREQELRFDDADARDA
jgi:hypothetical protein